MKKLLRRWLGVETQIDWFALSLTQLARRVMALEQAQQCEPLSDSQITKFIEDLTAMLPPPADAGRLEQRWFVNWVRRNLPKSDTGNGR